VIAMEFLVAEADNGPLPRAASGPAAYKLLTGSLRSLGSGRLNAVLGGAVVVSKPKRTLPFRALKGDALHPIVVIRGKRAGQNLDIVRCRRAQS
jgi:hypothetical protein